MYAKNCSAEDLRKALYEVNKKYARNVCFNQFPELRGSNRLIFTIKVRDSRKPGHRRGFPHNGKKGKRLAHACWHVHGDFFDALFEINPDAVITSGKRKITASQGNWIDQNIGSMVQPYMFSEACDCGSQSSLFG